MGGPAWFSTLQSKGLIGEHRFQNNIARLLRMQRVLSNQILTLGHD